MDYFDLKHSFIRILFVFLIVFTSFQMFFLLRVNQSMIVQTIIFLLEICVLLINLKKIPVHNYQEFDSLKIKRYCFYLLLLTAIFSVFFWLICFYLQQYTGAAISIAKFYCVLLLGFGIYGAFKGFKRNTQWLSIYILCITLMFLISTFLAIVCDMPTTSITKAVQRYHLYALVGVLGSILGLWSSKWCFCK